MAPTTAAVILCRSAAACATGARQLLSVRARSSHSVHRCDATGKPRPPTMDAVQTTPTQCPYCGVGCGLLADVADGRLIAVRGDKIHPANRGRTCRKPLGLPFAVHADDRATVPLWRAERDARFEPAGWDDVLGTLAGRLQAIVDEHGPDAIAFYISGQLLTEDYYAVNKLAKGFLGTNNVDSNSRLCMSSAVAGYSGAFGFDGPPPAYEDIAHADCLLLLGTNTAACHPIVWSRIRDRQAEGAFVICADPRATQTAARRRPAPAGAPGHRPRAAQRAAGTSSSATACSTPTSSPATRAAGRTASPSRASGHRRAPRSSAASAPSSSSRPRTASPARARRWRCGRWGPTSRASGR